MTDTGVAVAVADGLATIDFIDPGLRGPALARLIDIGGPLSVETLTRRGPRRLCRVPEGNAREAGLLDDGTEVDAHASGDSGFAAALADAGHHQPDTASARVAAGGAAVHRRYPDGEPDDAWRRPELDAYANVVKGIDTTDLPTKADVLATINNKEMS